MPVASRRKSAPQKYTAQAHHSPAFFRHTAQMAAHSQKGTAKITPAALPSSNRKKKKTASPHSNSTSAANF